MNRIKFIILCVSILLAILIGFIKIPLKIEGEVYISCEDTTVTFPFKKSVSARLFAINSAKKAGEERAESMMKSLENMLEGATAEYEIISIKFLK